MEMMAFGMLEILVLLAGADTVSNRDLMSLVRPEDYFNSRKIPVKAADLAALAGKDPKDGKTQIQQLAALRWLGDNPAEVKKTEGARELLQQIADGKKANDDHGFAQGYARQALARIDGKPVPALAPAQGKAALADGLAWFPAECRISGTLDLRPTGPTLPAGKDVMAEFIQKAVPPREREFMYEVMEQLGNVRIDRLGFAMSFDEQGREQRIFVRLSGAGDRQRLASVLKATGKFETTEEKGPRGEPITRLSSQQSPPSFAIVGDGDVILAGFEKHQGNHPEVVAQALAVRAGKEKGVPDGPLGKLVGQAPGGARGVLAIDLNEGMRRDFLRGRPPISVAPQRLLAHVVRGGEGDATKPGLTINVEGSFSDGDEAKKAVKELEDLKQKGLKELDNAPKNRGIPPQALKAAKETLTALKLDTNGATAQARLSLPDAKLLTEMLRWTFESRPADAQPPLEKKPDRLPPPDKP